MSISVSYTHLPGVASLRSMTVNDQYKAGMKATYGESVNLNSHMAKIVNGEQQYI